MARNAPAPTSQNSPATALPEWLRPLFWEYDFSSLSWDGDRELITARILTSSNWKATRWLWDWLGDEELRSWIGRRQGRGLSPQQLRFWELLLKLPHRQVNSWLAARGPDSWERRADR